MTPKKIQTICPHCGKHDTWKNENKFKPFCSDRCKLIDLGDGADEKFRITGEESDVNGKDEDVE